MHRKSKILRFLPALAGVAVLCAVLGCKILTPPGRCGTLDGGSEALLAEDPDSDPLLPGAVSVALPQPTFGLCPQGYEYPKLADIQVHGADGQPIPATLARGRQGEQRVAFEAPQPGTYSLTGTYVPDAATGQPNVDFQAQVFVARDRRGLAGLVQVPRECGDLHRTSLGTWLCDEYVFRDGAVSEQLEPGWPYTGSGDSFWGTSPTGRDVVRWVDTGAGPLRRIDIVRDSSLAPGEVTALLSDGDELLVRLVDRLDRYIAPLDGGVPKLLSSTPLAGGSKLARRGEELLADQLSVGGDTSHLNTCVYRLEPSGLTPAGTPCLTNDSTAGMSEDGIWFQEGKALAVYTPRDGGVARAGFAFAPGALSYQYHGANAPGFLDTSDSIDGPRYYLLLPAVQGDGGIITELYDLPGQFIDARRDFAWTHVTADAGTSSTVVILR